MTEEQLLNEWRKLVEASADEEGLFTTAELCKRSRMSPDRARRIVRDLIEAGKVEGGHRKAVLAISGVTVPAVAYKWVG